MVGSLCSRKQMLPPLLQRHDSDNTNNLKPTPSPSRTAIFHFNVPARSNPEHPEHYLLILRPLAAHSTETSRLPRILATCTIQADVSPHQGGDICTHLVPISVVCRYVNKERTSPQADYKRKPRGFSSPTPPTPISCKDCLYSFSWRGTGKLFSHVVRGDLSDVQR